MSSEKPKEKFADVRRHLPFLKKREGLARLLERVLGYPKVRSVFADSIGAERPFSEVARRLGMEIRVEGLGENIPATGPVVVVANHAHGGADALAFMAEMKKVRSDFMTLANSEATLLAGLSEVVFPLNLLGSGDKAQNSTSLRAMFRHVKSGGALGVFPAGRVAYWQGDRMREPPWNENVVKMLLRMNAVFVPMWFFGNPPASVKFLSRLSPFVRTALIPTGLAMMRGREISARVGQTISAEELRGKGDDAGPWLRRELESLADLGD